MNDVMKQRHAINQAINLEIEPEILIYIWGSLNACRPCKEPISNGPVMTSNTLPEVFIRCKVVQFLKLKYIHACVNIS